MQWGTIETHSNQGVSIKFSISFSNTNYYVNELPFFIEDIGDYNPYDSSYAKFGYSKTVNGITIKDFCAWDALNVSWFAIGF